MSMDLAVGTKLKDKHRDAWIAALSPLLHPGEQLVVLARTNMLRPMCDGLVITNARIGAFWLRELSVNGHKVEAFADDLAAVEISRRRGSNYLVGQRRDGSELNFGAVHELDIDLVLEAGRQLLSSGTPLSVRTAVETRAAVEAADDDRWRQVEVIGQPLSDKAWRTIRDHAAPDEVSWFVIGVGSAGVLAAFADRCMIVKVGAMASMMAGSLGGGRITTFQYTDITGIEYNAGMINGVLELLTPSYQGTANKDYWRGSGSSVNVDANDPYTLSNTLPMAKLVYKQALPWLNQLRAKIAEAKRPTVVVQHAPVPPAAAESDLVSELTRLGTLHQQGLLTDAEFAAAKQAVIARHG